MTDKGKVTPTQTLFVAGLAAGFAICYHVFSGMDLIHELGHALFVVLRGGEVGVIRFDYITASGYDGMSAYMGTGFAIMVRAVALVWLSSKKANPAIVGWIWGRLVIEWLGWFVGNGIDASLMTWNEYVIWTGLHVSAFAGFVIGATVVTARMVVTWQPKEEREAQRKAKELADEMTRRVA
jgi:hypothetical protein